MFKITRRGYGILGLDFCLLEVIVTTPMDPNAPVNPETGRPETEQERVERERREGQRNA